MDNNARSNLREILFRVSVSLKGLDAAFEIVGGAALLAVSPTFILRAIAFITQNELAEDPRDLVANYALTAAEHLSIGTEHFAAYYLISHGVIKLALVVALLEKRLWAYPLAVIVFAAFIAYQIYRFTLTHSIGLIALSIFDLLVIWLIWVEYRALKRYVTPE
ncbi:MAG: DUF2127 domain-containing protein [Proteobacteria bacterium]|nr:DUF2127 domain-containing protein [Pseudomonadota bacterium]